MTQTTRALDTFARELRPLRADQLELVTAALNTPMTGTDSVAKRMGQLDPLLRPAFEAGLQARNIVDGLKGLATADGPHPVMNMAAVVASDGRYSAAMATMGRTLDRAAVDGVAAPRANGELTNGVTADGLNPAVSVERQRKTYEGIFARGAELARQGKTPVIVIDHRLTGMDDRPIIRAELSKFAEQNHIAELLGPDGKADLDGAFKRGVLKSLPGYTEQASDAWRDEHKDLLAKYPDASWGAKGQRFLPGFMGHSPREANAVEGLAELQEQWSKATGGKGQIIFAGSGTGTFDDFRNVYARPKAEGGGGFGDMIPPTGASAEAVSAAKVSVRFGDPSPSAEAEARAAALLAKFKQDHPTEDVRLDRDSRGKAGWIETIERERGSDGSEKVVAAFIDDRTHNRLGAQGAGKEGDRMILVKSAGPGISFAQTDNDNPNLISTFKTFIEKP